MTEISLAYSTLNVVRIPVGEHFIRGELVAPPAAPGIVICTGPRGACAAEAIRGAGNATLHLDLLTAEEQQEDSFTHSFRFDVPLLSQRLVAATRWLAHQPLTANFGFGYFGEEIAGAAALMAAAELGVVVDAVVCRHSRPDFAANVLPKIEAPTLLICTKSAEIEVAANRTALQKLTCEKQLQVLPPPCRDGETRRDCVGCSLAASWFKTYVRAR